MGDGKDKKFISERILGRDLTAGRALKFILVSILCGAVFGGAAFGVYYLASKKTAEAELAKAEASIAESIRASEAEQERIRMAETEPENPPETEPEGTQAAEETTGTNEESGENGETAEGTSDGEIPEESASPVFSAGEEGRITEIIAGERQEYAYSREDLGRILEVQKDACSGISKYIVTVSSFISETTWFESTVETERKYAGIIVSVDEEELLVLSVDTVANGSKDLKVRFFDGTIRDASEKKTSGRDGWTVLSVPTAGIPAECRQELEAVENVEVAEIAAGTPVITAGAPMGAVNSFGFGYVNYVGEIRSDVDGSYVCCYSEAPSHPTVGTFLMTVDGRLIGLGVEREDNSEATGNRFFIADSCSFMLENLKKGNDSAWLGITGKDVIDGIASKKIPEGMYVTGVEENSPAFAAGLKRGDIIANIGTRKINGLSDYCSFMRNLRPEETITMTVLRETLHSDYKELELEMTAGTR